MRYLGVLLIVVSLVSCKQKPSSINEFRGEDRAGIYFETDLLKQWPEEGPEEVLFIEGIGNGYGSPTFAEHRFYITGEIDSTAFLFCYSLEGDIIWKVALGKEWVTSFPGSRSAPTIVDDLVYAGTGMGNIYCLNTSDGSLVWSKNFVEDFDGVYPMHGHAEAPLVYKDQLFWTIGGEKHNVLSLNRFDGSILWSNSGKKEAMGYNPGKLIHLESRTIFVTFSSYHMMGFDVESGELLWVHEQDNYPIEEHRPGIGDTHSNSIVYEDGFIYYVEGDGNCGVKLQLSEDGSSIEEVWRNKKFDGYMGGIIRVNDYIYSSTSRDLRSASCSTGEFIDSLKVGPGALILADSMFYYYNWRSELNLIGYNYGQLEKISSFRITKGTKEPFAHPVIYQGIIYQRRGDALMGYSIKE